MMTYNEISKILNISPTRVQQIELNAFRKIRDNRNARKCLKEYSDESLRSLSNLDLMDGLYY